jgi:hypothetical protein
LCPNGCGIPYLFFKSVVFINSKEKIMEEVQSFDRPLAYDLARMVPYQHDENQNAVSNSLTISGGPEAGADVTIDF